MPSHPIATWITPCNSRNVQVLGTSTRRHTIGLIPSSQTLTCTISAASASAADEAVSTTGLVRFGARVTRPAYRRSPFPVAGTPAILMLSMIVHEPPLLAEPGDPENAGHRAPARRQDGSDQKHLGMPPTPLEEERRKAENDRGEAGWQSEHGGAPVAGTPQPNRSPTPLPRARKWPN